MSFIVIFQRSVNRSYQVREIDCDNWSLQEKKLLVNRASKCKMKINVS